MRCITYTIDGYEVILIINLGVSERETRAPQLVFARRVVSSRKG